MRRNYRTKKNHQRTNINIVSAAYTFLNNYLDTAFSYRYAQQMDANSKVDRYSEAAANYVKHLFYSSLKNAIMNLVI